VPLDSIISLAVALAEAPGSCVCLLGAGLSADAEVPTAQEILQDGLRALYRLETQTEDTPSDEDLAEWLKENGYEDLGYSTLLDQLAPDPAIRREMLAKHFEGVQPGAAHERLADLAAAGIIKVFITTNFDRLLERAIEARGIDPVVVSDDATLAAAPRREHSPVFIIKAHGDYLQETIRNTPSELSTLDPKLTEELRLIAAHYGLLVIGWRGADPALAEIVRGGATRYGAWWLSRTDPPAEPTRTIIETIGARTITRPTGAGEFLAELQRRLSVYETYETGDDPGSVHDEVLALIKRGEDVELDEVLRRERHVFEAAVDEVRADFAKRMLDDDAVNAGWAKLAPATDRRLASLIPLAVHRPALLEAEVRRHVAWASGAPARDGVVAWLQPWQFLFWILAMSLGGLALRLGRYVALHPLLLSTWTEPSGYVSDFAGPPGDLAQRVAAIYGPAPEGDGTWVFPSWQWLIADLQSKEWLVERYPDWLRRDGEPDLSFVAFAVLLNIAAGLEGRQGMIAWWTPYNRAAETFGAQLVRDSTMRAEIAEALGVDLQAFDQRAADIVRSVHGIGAFPEVERLVATLATLAPAQPDDHEADGQA
jgi:SIR2-like domain